jgi:N-acetyl-anhydromuramyl-L-alanine amidase AmpD
MKRIIIHWTAGGPNASAIDKAHYHFIVNGDGSIVRGVHKVADNASTSDGHYAAHTKGCNLDSIGISMAGMMNATKANHGKYPLKLAQWNACMKMVADLCKEYKIPMLPTMVLTHAEVQGTLGIQQNGKIDISFGVPGHPDLDSAKEVGAFIRSQVKGLM